MEYIISTILGVLGLTAIAVLLIVTGYKEYHLHKKIELLKHMIDHGYETNEVDINKI